MSTVRAVITNPFYQQPAWVSNVEYKETVYLSKYSSEEDAVLFLTLLCGYNNVALNNKGPAEVVHELIHMDDVAMSGGIAFRSNEKLILPSCCCGLEQWTDVLNDVIKKSSPWLGHDPTPCIEYCGDSARIWSDDFLGIYYKDVSIQDKETMFFIEYKYKELIKNLMSIEED